MWLTTRKYIDINKSVLFVCVVIRDFVKTMFFLGDLIDRVTVGNNLLCFYDCMFNPTVRLQINRLLCYRVLSIQVYLLKYNFMIYDYLH